MIRNIWAWIWDTGCNRSGVCMYFAWLEVTPRHRGVKIKFQTTSTTLVSHLWRHWRLAGKGMYRELGTIVLNVDKPDVDPCKSSGWGLYSTEAETNVYILEVVL